MSAPEQSQGVLLRYAGGTVYAVSDPRADGLTLRVAGVSVAVSPWMPCPVRPTESGFETGGTLTDLVAADAHHRRMAAEAAEHARVTLEMQRAPKRPARRAGKAKRRVAAKGGR